MLFVRSNGSFCQKLSQKHPQGVIILTDSIKWPLHFLIARSQIEFYLSLATNKYNLFFTGIQMRLLNLKTEKTVRIRRDFAGMGQDV
jgi:hypothetical protein